MCRLAEESHSQPFDRPQAGSQVPIEVMIPAKAHPFNRLKNSHLMIPTDKVVLFYDFVMLWKPGAQDSHFMTPSGNLFQSWGQNFFISLLFDLEH